ncbi:Pentatricopeptide repeat [Dillenia turbinata]|uniref:Pentatricopeptide repeat n=1 Tax=Dillenia turbinata TaxID=194707 RepID=A0AAN8UEK8_9MAGN
MRVRSYATRNAMMTETGVSTHGFIEKTIYGPENDVFIDAALVDMYSECGCLDSAVAIFDRMRRTNIWTWTAIITGLAFHGKGSGALELLHSTESYGTKLNKVTFTSLLSACCHGGLVEEGLHLFYEMENRFFVVPRSQHYGCMVDFHRRAGHLEEAYEFIMSRPVDPDAVLWTLLGRSIVQSDDSSEDYLASSNIYASKIDGRRLRQLEM